jgi:hypothetical protein
VGTEPLKAWPSSRVLTCKKYAGLSRRYENQGTLKGEVSLYTWPPVWPAKKTCQLSYSWFQTSQTGGQQYSDTSPFSIICENQRQRKWGFKLSTPGLLCRCRRRVLVTTPTFSTPAETSLASSSRSNRRSDITERRYSVTLSKAPNIRSTWHFSELSSPPFPSLTSPSTFWYRCRCYKTFTIRHWQVWAIFASRRRDTHLNGSVVMLSVVN